MDDRLIEIDRFPPRIPMSPKGIKIEIPKETLDRVEKMLKDTSAKLESSLSATTGVGKVIYMNGLKDGVLIVGVGFAILLALIVAWFQKKKPSS